MFDFVLDMNKKMKEIIDRIKTGWGIITTEIKEVKRNHPRWNSMRKLPKKNKAVTFFVEDEHGEKKVISKYAMFDGKWWFYSYGHHGELILERESSDVVQMLEYLYKKVKWAYTNDWNMDWYGYNLIVKRDRKREKKRKKELKKKMKLQAKLEKSGKLVVEERKDKKERKDT